ncbi:hypothetical protein [Oceanomicrobium pacificus]|uniref:Uncharacterized protein n=1 Tax=Oceanomicrobium pacificus TaxID=2692916 RepID=A0A6B0TJX0_9RHOB|nr:hypothetical protein [Oceanomicrobium pacificus]MXU64156.1 hypothetical protein [Oceanomicrobium pacificus]
MRIEQIGEHARKLYAARGDAAEACAAQKAAQCRDEGRETEADDWLKIRAAIAQLRGPNES